MTNELIQLGLNLKVVGVDDLRPHPRNYNRHDPAQVSELGASLDKFSQYKNIVAWRDPNNGAFYILAGHGLWEAAKERGDVHIAVNDRSDLTPERAEALMISDNFTPSADFDFEILAPIVEELGVVEIPGLDEMRFQEILAQVNGDQSDEPPESVPPTDKAEELQAQWGVADGDIWRAGPHFVICGDCREPETWRRLLGVAGVDKANGVFTSPPYAEQRKKQYGGVSTDEYVDWWEAVQQNVRANLADDGSFFVNIKPHCTKGERVLYVFDLVLAMKRRWGWRFVDELCWYNTQDGYPGKYDPRFRNAFEPVFHFCMIDKPKFRKWNIAHVGKIPGGLAQKNQTRSGFENWGEPIDGLALPSNVIKIPAVGSSETIGHAAAFPVALPDFFIRAYSDPGDVWVDQFLGSGTTVIAAHQADGGQRIGLGIEKLAKYVSVCLERFANTLGLEPELVRNV